MIWEFAAGAVAGLAIGEYYRRVFDRIRREQLTDLRKPCMTEPQPKLQPRNPEPFDELTRAPRRTSRPLVTEEKHDELKRTGATAGKRVNGEIR